MKSAIAEAYLLVILSSSGFDISFGLQITPPFAPPKGMSAMLHFQVIQHARALTSSRVTLGWQRIPPLEGPRASLSWTLYPVKPFTPPASTLTVRPTEETPHGPRR